MYSILRKSIYAGLLVILAGCSAPKAEPTNKIVLGTPLPNTPTSYSTKTDLPEPTETATFLPSTSSDDFSSGRVVFYSERDGNAEIYTMNPNGIDQKRLTFNQFEDVAPVWSPGGLQIAFLSNRDDPDPGACFPECFYQLYIINADGSDEHRLTDTGFSIHHPDWHPDGSKLSFDTEFNLEGDIYTLNADGSGFQLLIEDGFWAAWSGDGTQIVYASNRDGNIEIYQADADGSNQQRLTHNSRMDFFPAWSPNGEKIAFMAGDYNERQIFIMNPDGSNEQQLTFKGHVNEDPGWSPDGNQIVFQSNRGGNYEIYSLNIEEALNDNSKPQQLTNTPAGDYWPSWFSETISISETEISTADQMVVSIPQGKPPIIDGTISTGEWEDALVETFADGSELLLLQNKGYLYLAIRANTTEMIVGNIFFNRGDQISIFHTSAALGTAIYQQEAESWQQVQEFDWCCRDTHTGASAQAERDAFFHQERWVSVNSRVGTPNELEYKIEFRGDPINFAVNYLTVFSNPHDEKLPWPPLVDDDVIRPTPGGLPMQLFFSPDKWAKLQF